MPGFAPLGGLPLGGSPVLQGAVQPVVDESSELLIHGSPVGGFLGHMVGSGVDTGVGPQHGSVAGFLGRRIAGGIDIGLGPQHGSVSGFLGRRVAGGIATPRRR